MRKGKSVILLIEQSGRLKIMIDPIWQSFVDASDQKFIQDCIADFAERAQSDPMNLFEQCLALNLGPLQTEAEGLVGAEHPKLLDAIRRFIDLT